MRLKVFGTGLGKGALVACPASPSLPDGQAGVPEPAGVWTGVSHLCGGNDWQQGGKPTGQIPKLRNCFYEESVPRSMWEATENGGNIQRLCTVFPHWFCANFRKYIDKDGCLSFDQHMVVSLIAPRPVYIASAEEDANADPLGEFLTAKAADSIYRFLGTKGLPADTMPPVGHPVFA